MGLRGLLQGQFSLFCLNVFIEPIFLSEILSFWTISIVLVLKKQTKGNTTFRKLDLFPSLRTMDIVRKLNISESYTPSSESYSNYLNQYCSSFYAKYIVCFGMRVAYQVCSVDIIKLDRQHEYP
jgi:hypothetical protein